MGIKIPPSTRTQEAVDTPMENRDIRDNDFKAEDVQTGMEEIDFRRETREPTGFLCCDDYEIEFDNVLRRVTISPSSGNTTWDYYIWGEKFTVTGNMHIDLPAMEGYYTVYLGKDYDISYTINMEKEYNEEYFKVAHAYYSVGDADIIWWGEASSLLSMPWGTQQRISGVQGVEVNNQDFIFKNYIENGDGTLDAHAQLGLDGGTLYHEDRKFLITHDASPTHIHWTQDIDSIAKIPIYYREGTGLRKLDATDFPMAVNTGGRLYFNEWTGSVWQLTEAPNNTFVSVYYYATINPREPIIGFLGKTAENSPSQSIDQDVKYLAGFPNHDFAFLKVGVWQTSDQFTNTPKARLFRLTEGIEAIGSDRYVITAEYGGNANAGRWLEFTKSESSDIQPLLIPEDSFIRTVTLQTTSTLQTGDEIAFYENDDLVTPRFVVTVPAAGNGMEDWTFDVTQTFLKNENISVQVYSGNVRKPVVRFWIETSP